MSDAIIHTLEKIENTIDLIIGTNDFFSEHYFTWGPNQGIVAQLRRNAIRAKYFFIHSLNTGTIISPLLILQILLYFLKAGIATARMAMQRKVESVNDIADIVLNVLAAIFTTAVTALLLMGSLKVVSIIYCIQAGIEAVISSANFFRHSFVYAKKTYEYFKIKNQAKKITNKFENNKFKMDNRYQAIKKERAEQAEAIKSSGKKMLLASVIVALTVLSFFAPIPIVCNIAQVALVVIVTTLFVIECVDRYKKYKEAKQLKRDQIAAEDTKIEPGKDVKNEKNAKLAHKLTNTESNRQQKIMWPFVVVKTKLGNILNRNKKAASTTVVAAAITAALTMTSPNVSADLSAAANPMSVQIVNVVDNNVTNKDAKGKDTQNNKEEGKLGNSYGDNSKSPSSSEISLASNSENEKRPKEEADDKNQDEHDLTEHTAQNNKSIEEDNNSNNGSKPKAPNSPENSVVTSIDNKREDEFSKEASFNEEDTRKDLKTKYGNKQAAYNHYKNNFFAKNSMPKNILANSAAEQIQDLPESEGLHPGLNSSSFT